MGAVALLASQSIFQTVWYYAGGLLGPLSDGLSLGASVVLLAGCVSFKFFQVETLPHEGENTIRPKEASWTTFAVLACVAASLFLIVNALQAATHTSVNSPWPLLPAGTFIAVALLFASGFLASIKARPIVVAGLVALSLLTLSSLTPLIYPLGYGFDGFLHRASEEVILQTGTLTPHPPTYIGQYTLVTWFARVLHVPQSLGDIWFVAALALLLPFAAYQLSATKKRKGLTILSLLIALPLGILSASTPQNVAYLLGVLSLLWLIPADAPEATSDETVTYTTSLLVPWLLLAWSLATHPLAGMPFALAGCALSVQTLRQRWIKRTIVGTTLLASLFAVPLAFSVRAALQGGAWSWAWLKNLPTAWGWLTERFLQPATHLALWPDWANWQSYLFTFVLLAAALFAVTRDKARRSLWLTLISFAVSASASSWLLQTSGDFSFLISYERQDYAARLLVVAQLFFLPAALVGLGYWFERIEHTHPRMRAAALLLGIAWFSANVYNMLPRHDAAAIGHGWNVGRSDLEAVQFIDKQANGQPYTVLANQTVSAAAVSVFGFKRYVGDIFYYPIPTGGPLYEQFLQMMDHPNLDIAQETGSLGQSKLVYVVVNNYWFKAEQLIERLKGISDRTWNVEHGAAYIFLFDLSTTSNASTTRTGS
jgi:hypothetical protein